MAKRTEYELQIAIGGKVDNSLSKSVKDINSKLDSIGSTAKAVVGAAATAFTSIQIKNLFDETTEASKEMQTSMAGVAKVVDGLKDENGKVTKSYYEMKESILDLSENLPKTAEDIAAIMEAAGQSNIAKDELLQFAEDATKMGVAFDTTAEQAGEWMAAWRTALNLDQKGVVTLADQINYLGNTTTEDALKISEVVTRIGQLANTAGISAASVAALSASMTKVAPEVAATGIKNFALALVAGDSATKKQAKTFKTLGLEASKVAKAMQVDSQGTIIDVLERINKLDKDKQTSVMKNLFGSESLASIAPLVANLDNLKTQFEKVGNSALYAGSMEQEYLSASSTVENIDILKDNKIKAMQIKIGDILLPLSATISETTGNLAQMFGDFVEENAPILNEAIRGIQDTFQENLPNIVYGLKSLAEGGKNFLNGFRPVIDLIEDNPSLVPNFLKSTGAAIVSYKIGKNLTEIAKGAKAAGSPLKLLSGIITNPWALAIGAVAGGIALIATNIASAEKELRAADLASRFGDITLSLEDLEEIASQIIQTNSMGKLSESIESTENISSIVNSIDDTVAILKKYNWKVSIGLELTEEEQQAYQANITNFITESQNLLMEERYKLNINMQIFTDDSEAGVNIRDKMNAFYDKNYETVSTLGKKLQDAVNDAFSDGLLTIDESEVISKYMQEISEINAQIANAELDASLIALGSKYDGTALTPESFQNLQAELGEQIEKRKEAYTDELAKTLYQYNEAFKNGGMSEKEYNDAVNMAKDKYHDHLGELESKALEFQYQTILNAYKDEIDKAMPEFEKLLTESVNESMENISRDGTWGKELLFLYDELSDFDGIDKKKRKNISALLENMLPTQESLEQLRDSYVENGKQVPEWLSQGLSDVAALGALTGNIDSIMTMVGYKIAESPEHTEMVRQAHNTGVLFEQEFIDGMQYNNQELQKTASGMLEIVKSELAKGVTVDVPINVHIDTSKSQIGIPEGGWRNFNNKALQGLGGHKEGGIFNTPHIAWFAEDGPEAAIPLDGSPEAIQLWQMAGQILGMFENKEYQTRSYSIPYAYQQLVQNTSSSNHITNSPSINIEYNIKVEKGADSEKVQKAIVMSQAQFNYMMNQWEKDRLRTNMSGGRR